MATRTTLKGYFQTGDKPTQSEFAELIEGVPNLTDSSVTDAEFAQLNGVTSPIQTQIDGKQATLVNQTNIKSVNGETLLGSGDLTVSSSAAWGGITGTLSSQTDLQSALDLKEDVIAAGTTSEYYRGDKSFVALDKTAVGLPNVDNTSDANKPVSTATQTALDLKQDDITLTTTGTSGTATLVGSTLNVPDYGSAASSVAWGDITGTLSNQTDLDTALDLKANVAAPTFTGDITSNAVSIISNSTSATTLLIGDVTLGDTITEMRLQAFGADLINLQDQEVTLKSDSLKITGSLSTTAPETYLGLLSSTGAVTKRTPAQVLADIGAAPASGGSYLPLAGGAMTGAITTNSTFDGRDVAADGVTADAALPKTGGEMTGAITGNVAITGFRPYLRETTTERILALTDAGTFISAENESGTEVTIPINGTVAFTQGTEIDFIQKTAGALEIAGDTGVTLNGTSGGSVAVTAQWGGVTIKKIAEDEWIAVGKI